MTSSHSGLLFWATLYVVTVIAALPNSLYDDFMMMLYVYLI